MSGTEDPHSVIRFLFGGDQKQMINATNISAIPNVPTTNTTTTTTTTTPTSETTITKASATTKPPTIAGAGPSLSQVPPGESRITPPSSPTRAASDLSTDIAMKDQRIAQLEGIIVKLQDLLVSSPRLTESDIQRGLHAIMGETSISRKLDVQSLSSFSSPPSVSLNVTAEPFIPSTRVVQPQRPSPLTTAAQTPVVLPENDLLEEPLDGPVWPSMVSSFQVQSQPIPVDRPLQRFQVPYMGQPGQMIIPTSQRSTKGPPTPTIGRKSVPAIHPSFDIAAAEARGAATLEELRGQIVGLIKYQAGCRFLQKQIDWSSNDPARLAAVIDVMLDDICPNMFEVITDSFGQYLLPKIMECANTEERTRIVQSVSGPNLVQISCNAFGSHGLQRLLSFMSDEQSKILCDALAPHIVELSKDAKGNYILQSFLKTFGPGNRVQSLQTVICENFTEIACHKVGCTVVCRAVDRADNQQLKNLVDLVVRDALMLVQDQYGNYVTQHILTHCGSEFTKPLINSLRGHMADLCFQKFSSNVVEKCLAASDPETFEWMIVEMTEQQKLVKLIQDPFGNFVLQKLLDLATPEQHKRLVRLIVPLLHDIKSQYAVHIQKKLLHV